MSGTSMDGLDLAYTSFTQNNEGTWSYELIASQEFEYPQEILKKLRIATTYSATELLLLDKELGKHFGRCVNHFLIDQQIPINQIDAIASHGHTIFHQPEKGFTYQIGCGATISKITGINTINDFRTKDVIHGGQGAPLVPIGDKLLFSHQADAFLNIGGFTNICIPGETTIAFDISPGNLPSNRITQHFFKCDFDKNGRFAERGKILPTLLKKLNTISFYELPTPKSLGTEWLDEVFMPKLPKDEAPEDLLRTITEHIASQITEVLKKHSINTILLTGGGAKNTFLVNRIKELSGVNLAPCETHIIDFKEAIIFAFLGTLYLSDFPNTIASVTGAKKSVCAGVLHKA